MTLMMGRAEGAPMWIELRRELRKQKVDPTTAVLVESYGEDREEVGVVVAPEDRVLVYRLCDGEWTWTDITDRWDTAEFADQVQVGLRILM